LPELLYRDFAAGDDARLKAITDTRTALLAGLVGIGALLSFMLNRRQYRIAEQGHITDRYNNAIGLLGDGAIAMRLGGIYALERIARDSRRDSGTVIEVLSAFIRSGRELSVSGATPSIRAVVRDWIEKYFSLRKKLERGTKTIPGNGGLNVNEPPVVGADIEAALTVLARMPRSKASPTIDLSNAKLRGVRLERGRADLSGARMAGADLRDSRLAGAKLVDCWLHKANFAGAYLHKVNLRGSHLGGVDLTGVQGLTQEQLDLTTGDSATILPNYLKRPLKWYADRQATLDESQRAFDTMRRKT
jgi:hypothetical protein